MSPAAGNACDCVTDAIACTLQPDELPGRLAQWQHLAEHVVERVNTREGIRVRFDRDVSAAEVADLAAKEQGCCSFFAFTLRIAAEGTVLEISAPDRAQEFVGAFFDLFR
jgi:hypothetical protein